MLPLQPQGAFRLTLLHEIATSGACSNRPYRENLMSGAPLPPSTKCDERLDGYKGLLILFVVIGHAIEILCFPGTSLSVYLAIYAFHMPAFLLIAGALTRARRPADELVETARRLAPPYLFGVVGAALIRLAESGTLSVSFFPPPWTLWFLLTLATLRIASHSLERIMSHWSLRSSSGFSQASSRFPPNSLSGAAPRWRSSS